MDVSCGQDTLVSRAATLSAAWLGPDSYAGGALAQLLYILIGCRLPIMLHVCLSFYTWT
jgi:hypothetical protein